MKTIKEQTVDPFTLEIVKDSLVAIGEEMFHTLARTSMSPVIYEVLDYASGLTDAKGQLLTQGNRVTGFIGMLTFMVKETLEKFEGDLKPGTSSSSMTRTAVGAPTCPTSGSSCPSSWTVSLSHSLRTRHTGRTSVARTRVPSAMTRRKFTRRPATPMRQVV